ncbi:MAG: hypothetical protein NTZ79_03895 [Proteobacteria bacterium]|nr:hypothetical protein [Pseudomonadota bacterium]
MKKLSILLLAFLLASCALPETRVTTGAAPAGLVVEGAPAGATLYIDGLAMGLAAEFNGKPKVLTVLEGAHNVEIRVGSAVVFGEKAFVSNGEVHKVRVIGGATP